MKGGICFGGAGHWAVAMKNAGMNPVWYYEKWQPAVKCFKLNLPYIIVFESIKDIPLFANNNDKNLFGADIIVGSPHCNGLSNANPKNNIDHPSNQCMFDFIEVIAKCKPRFFIMEESHRLLTCNKFMDLRRKICEKIYESEYLIKCLVLDSNDYGSPQKRKRSYIIGFKYNADYNKFYLPDKRTSPKAIDVLPEKQYQMNIDYRCPPRKNEKGPFSIYANDKIRIIGDTCPTITGWAWEDMWHPDKRFLATAEIASLMGFPADYKFEGSIPRRCGLIAKGVDIRFVAKLLGQFKKIGE
jgi:DNA-cytosine methyltransferase